MFLAVRNGMCRFILLILLLQIGGWSFAQLHNTGILRGIVKDETDAVIPGVTVALEDGDGAHLVAVTTDGAGQWRMEGLPSGTYSIKLSRKGFEPVSLKGIVPSADGQVPIVTKMRVATVQDVANVFAEAEQLHADTAEIGKSVFAEDLENITSATRSFTGIISGMTGVSADISKSLVNTTGNSSPSINGARTTSTSLHFNGIDSTNLSSGTGSMDDNIAPAVDFLEEVRVQSSMYDAGVGRSGGGNVMLFTRSGEEMHHGSAFIYVQNEALNANEFFLKTEGIDRPVGRRHEGGFTLGGPFPWMHNRIRFFGGYQYTDAKTAYVPTARTLTQLPSFLAQIRGERTESAILAAIEAESLQQGNDSLKNYWRAPGIYAKTPLSPIAQRILNLKNPVTGDYWIPSPRKQNIDSNCNNSYGTYIRGLCDDGTISNKSEGRITGFKQGIDGNFRMPFSQERFVSPATFKQTQYTARLDLQITQKSYLAANYFYADFPSVDPFTDPYSQASPVSVKKLNRAHVASLASQQLIGNGLMNEFRVGFYALRNTRQLDDAFLGEKYTNTAMGISNPSTFFENSIGSNRLARFSFKNNISHFSFGGTNDAFNQKDLRSYSLADNASWIKGAHHVKFGGEVKYHRYNTNYPEQQGAEFKFDGFFQFLIGQATEAITRFGVTEKRFRMKDFGFFLADDWKINSKLTLNLGLRWDVFGAPEERDGRIANFDVSLLKNPDSILSGFVVASNARETGFKAIDRSLKMTRRSASKSTLKGTDLTNIAPRFGFAFTPLSNRNFVVRGGYGIFYDRPSASFINTIYKNYPYTHQIKIGAPHGMVPIDKAFTLSDPEYAFSEYLPYHIELLAQYTDAPFGARTYAYRYDLRDSAPVSSYVDGRQYNKYLGTDVLPSGNSAVPFEFRAIDPGVRTPYIQQYNLGIEMAFWKDWMFEIRYQGSKGTKLLQAKSFNQPYDLNDPSTPDHIFGRLNEAYAKAYELAGASAAFFYPGRLPEKSGWNGTERERGVGKAFGYANPVTGRAIDYNLSSQAYSSYTHLPDSTNPYPYLVYTPDLNFQGIIPLAIRAPILGLDPANATILQSNGNSSYNALQMSLVKRFSSGYSLNLAYTWSKSIDVSSSDPGGAPGASRPDVASSGNIIMGDQRNIGSSRAVSDFDRSHRFTVSFALSLPSFGCKSRWIKGWQLNGSGTYQSGAPYSIYAGGQELTRLIQYYDPNHREAYSTEALKLIDSFLFVNPKHVPDVNPLAKSTGGLYGALYVRPSATADGLKALKTMGKRSREGFFNTALLLPSGGGFGNVGRNVLRAAPQKKMDLGLSRRIVLLNDKASLQLRIDVMNVLNNVNYAAPVGDLADYYNLGNVLYTIGGPRVMQGSMRLSF